MLEYRLFGPTQIWRRRHRLRPMVLAAFSYRYDAELVPDLLSNIEPVVDGWVAFDDRDAGQPFSSEPRRRRILIERARELGATWVLALDPDERVERGAASRIRGLTGGRERIVWEFNLREMFNASSYRVDGIWGSKMQGRLFPAFDGPLCSEQPLHGAWCEAPAGYSVLPAGLNLYHLKMISPGGRLARRNLYQHLDPANQYQKAGYNYLVDEEGAAFEQIPPARDFFPAHRETGQLYMADLAPGSQTPNIAPGATGGVTRASVGREVGTTAASQLDQLRVAVGELVCRECRLAVVVIGLSAPRSLRDAVRSLIQQDTPSEIIVVNSGGGDVSDVLGEYLQHVVVVELAEAAHVGAARNAGIQMSRAPFVAFLAGDCIAASGWVAERTRAHMEGELAVASVVENDKARNPFAWAAHLMTYGQRMPGAPDGQAAAYGASYDRTLFDKYGYFSEALAIGEDSEFHRRFRPADIVWLRNSIRTVHRNPAGPAAFLKDQFRRGLRRRYLTDFLGVDFSIAYVALATYYRLVRPLQLSVTLLRGKKRLAAISSWPLLPFGALAFAAGMLTSSVKVKYAQHVFRKAGEMASLGLQEAALGLLVRAIELRPVTAQYHLALGQVLKAAGANDRSARELYASWDISRQDLIHQHWGGGRRGPSTTEIETPADPVRLQVIVFSDSSEVQLAEFLKAISAQTVPIGLSDVIVVDDDVHPTPELAGVRQSYAQLAKFVSPAELAGLLADEDRDLDARTRSFIAVSSSSCTPPPDWLAVLKAHIITCPEAELFLGNCRPQRVGGEGRVERISYDLGLFPRTSDRGGILWFAHAANWACHRSLLVGSGGLTHDGSALGVWTLTERAMNAGASSIHASEWQSVFRIDSTLMKLLRRFYRDGYYGAKHFAVTKDRSLALTLFPARGLDGAIAAAWRFATDGFGHWRLADGSFIGHAPAFLLLLSAGLARQIGWLAGLRKFGDGQIQS